MVLDGILMGGASFASSASSTPSSSRRNIILPSPSGPFLLAGLFFPVLSLFLPGPVPSTITGVAGFSSLWGIREL